MNNIGLRALFSRVSIKLSTSLGTSISPTLRADFMYRLFVQVADLDVSRSASSPGYFNSGHGEEQLGISAIFKGICGWLLVFCYKKT